jgi:hypothetical protein
MALIQHQKSNPGTNVEAEFSTQPHRNPLHSTFNTPVPIARQLPLAVLIEIFTSSIWGRFQPGPKKADWKAGAPTDFGA